MLMDVIIGLIFGGFILTMRNVNKGIIADWLIGKLSFILTMRNVNVRIYEEVDFKGNSFILTMRNVNNINETKWCKNNLVLY